jgi:hypothetical protein
MVDGSMLSTWRDDGWKEIKFSTVNIQPKEDYTDYENVMN